MGIRRDKEEIKERAQFYRRILSDGWDQPTLSEVELEALRFYERFLESIFIEDLGDASTIAWMHHHVGWIDRNVGNPWKSRKFSDYVKAVKGEIVKISPDK